MMKIIFFGNDKEKKLFIEFLFLIYSQVLHIATLFIFAVHYCTSTYKFQYYSDLILYAVLYSTYSSSTMVLLFIYAVH